MYTNWLRQ